MSDSPYLPPIQNQEKQMQQQVLYPPLGTMANNNPPNFNGQISPMIAPAPMVMVQLGGEQQRMQCPHCGAEISTEVKYRNGRMTHLAALLLCVFGCICCVCVPYCVESCKDAEHTCPHCNKHLGHYRR